MLKFFKCQHRIIIPVRSITDRTDNKQRGKTDIQEWLTRIMAADANLSSVPWLSPIVPRFKIAFPSSCLYKPWFTVVSNFTN